MTNWQYPLLAAVGVLFVLALFLSALRKQKLQNKQDFTRSLETLLQPKETVKVICPQKGFQCILTNNRIILEKKGRFTAFPLNAIQRIQGTNEEGNRTTVPKKMVTLTVKLEQELILRNTGDGFEEAAKYLQEKLKKRDSRKKSAKNT